MPDAPNLIARTLLRAQPDARLVALTREGREAAFEEIVRRYRPALTAFASAYVSANAEDVVQESLTSSWRALRASHSEINLKPWLYTIVRNRALNARRDGRQHEPLHENIDGVPQPPDVVLGRDELARVVAAVAALPDQQREALVRSALEGHSHEQIAEAIGATPGAVRGLIYRGRTGARHALGALVPLPFLDAALGLSSGAAGGAAVGGGAGLISSKTGAIAVVGVLAAGSGIAVERAVDDDERERTQIAKAAVNDRERVREERGTDAGGVDGADGSRSAAGQGRRDGSSGSGAGADRGEAGERRERSEPEREIAEREGPEREDGDDDRSGPGGGGSDDAASADGGGSSGPGGGDNSGPGGGGSSGSGSSGSDSGSSGSGGDGSGSGDDNSGPSGGEDDSFDSEDDD